MRRRPTQCGVDDEGAHDDGRDEAARRSRSTRATRPTPGSRGMVITESGRTAYLSAAVAAIEDLDLDLATGVAVAFPRSPMVTASTAWELAQASGGRFRLGLGTQVRAHIERRYSSAFDHPGPRLRDYVLAVKACFAGFRGREARPPRRVLRPVAAPADVVAGSDRRRRPARRPRRGEPVDAAHDRRGRRRRARAPAELADVPRRDAAPEPRGRPARALARRLHRVRPGVHRGGRHRRRARRTGAR